MNNKDADQPAHLFSLISSFVVHCVDSMMPMVALSKISRHQLASLTKKASFKSYLVA